MELRSFTRTPEDPMTDDRLPLAELLAKAGDGDFLRSVAEAVVQLLMAWGEPWPKPWYNCSWRRTWKG